MASLGCGGLYLLDRLLAYRHLYYLVGQRVYVHALIIGHPTIICKPCGNSNLTSTPSPERSRRARLSWGYSLSMESATQATPCPPSQTATPPHAPHSPEGHAHAPPPAATAPPS